MCPNLQCCRYLYQSHMIWGWKKMQCTAEALPAPLPCLHIQVIRQLRGRPVPFCTRKHWTCDFSVGRCFSTAFEMHVHLRNSSTVKPVVNGLTSFGVSWDARCRQFKWFSQPNCGDGKIHTPSMVQNMVYIPANRDGHWSMFIMS